MKSGLKPAVKNRAAHGGEECAARMVKTKADALGIGGQAPICGAVWRTEGERNLISPHLCGRQSISPVQARALSRRIAEKPEALGKEKK